MPVNRFLIALFSMATTLTLSASAPAADPPQALKLEKGDRIGIIGNTLPDRMQHHGWLETAIYAVHPDQELVIRNLGYAGDEVDPDISSGDFANKNKISPVRQRSDNFGSPKEWLTKVQANVVFAFYGYNESFAGAKGLEKFKSNLDGLLKSLASEKFDGKSNPRIVLFSPIAQENLKDPNIIDGTANNKNIKLYADAMAGVARANGAIFVDLFTPSQELYASAARPLTVNGIHPNEDGSKALAQVIARALFPEAGIKMDTAQLNKLREAVLDKSETWFQRYRVLDGYNVYGGRSKLAYNKITNFEVLQREMEMLDVMTANRDKKLWAAAQGKDFKVDDSNTPPAIPVTTNKPGKGPNGTHLFNSGLDSISHMKTPANVKINLFASEEQFPDLISPVQMAFDNKGRLWVATWPTYPHWEPKKPMNDKILIFEDTDGDGKADKVTVFADHLSSPTGFEFYNGGILVAQAPDLWFMKDTNGDDKADVIERVLSGNDSADSHHTANSFSYDPGGAIYFQEGTFMHSQVESPYGPPERSVNGAVWRFEPRTFKSEVYMAYGFANPHGHVFDRWGTDIITDGTGAVPYYGPTATSKMYFPNKHGKAPVIYKQHTRPCPGAEVLSSNVFPPEYQQNYLVANVIFPIQGILRYRLDEEGAGVKGKELEPLVSSDDPNFRPSDVETGPDGAVYFLDWQNPIIGHMQHHLRDPSRDHAHGRIYRVTYEGRPLSKPASIAGAPIETLLENLKSSEDRVRYRTRIELGARDTKEVISAVQKWAAGLDKADKDYDHNMTEALWIYSWHNVVNEDLLNQVLKLKDYHARAAGTRVLCYWRDRVKNPLALLKTLAVDDSPRVRLEAVRACSFFTDPAAQEAALESVNKPQDEWLKYSLEQTLKTLEKVAK